MTDQTAVEQHLAQPDGQEHPTEPSTMKWNIPYSVEHLRGRLTAIREGLVEKRRSAPSEHLAGTAALLVGFAALAIVTLFLAGFMRERTERGLRHLVDRAEQIDVPLFLPVSFARAALELFTDRDISAKPSAKSR